MDIHHHALHRSLGAAIATALALALAFAGVAGAQTVSPLVVVGDDVPGVGLITRIDNLAVNANGEWIVEADTNNPDTNADQVLIKNGALFAREGEMLPAPAPMGVFINSFDAVTLNSGSRSGFNFFLGGTGGTSTDSGVFLDLTLVIQESDISTAPEFTPGTPYIGFFEVKINDSNQLLLMASVDDPMIPTTVDRAIVLVDVDPNGVLLSETVLYKEGDILPGQTETVADFGTGPHDFHFNDLGQVIYFADMTGPTDVDGVVYLNDTLLAQEGSPSPAPGRVWLSLSTGKVGLNDLGEWVLSGSLQGETATNFLIEKNGAPFVQKGDSLPDIAPFTFTTFGSGPIWIGNNGRVLWYGDWDDPDLSRDTGLFIDHTLIVQEGVSTVNGVVIMTLRGIQDGYILSKDGRYVLFEAILAGGIEGAFLIDLDGPTPGTFCFGDGSGSTCPCGNEVTGFEGCANSSGAGATLAMGGSASVSADDLTFTAAGLLDLQPALLFAGETQVNGGDGVFFGDGLRCVATNLVRLGIVAPDGAGTAQWGPGLGAIGGWMDGDLRHFQVWYRDPFGGPCGTTFNLSHGYSISFFP